MKFQSNLESSIYQPWLSYYIDYKRLKYQIALIVESRYLIDIMPENNVSENSSTINEKEEYNIRLNTPSLYKNENGLRNYAKQYDLFWCILKTDIDKVNHFYISKEEEYSKILDSLNIDTLISKEILSNTELIESIINEFSISNNAPSSPIISNESISSNESDKNDYNMLLGIKPIISPAGITATLLNHNDISNDILNRLKIFTELCINMDRLRKYVILNYVAVIKILKKLDKNTGQFTKEIYIESELIKEPFYSSNKLNILIARTELIASQFLMNSREKHSINFDNNFTCSICLHVLRNPVVLSCVHRFCWTCLAQAATFGKSCPICRKELDLNPSNYQVDGLLQRFLNLHFAPSKDDERPDYDSDQEMGTSTINLAHHVTAVPDAVMNSLIPNASPKSSPKESPKSIRSRFELIHSTADNSSVGTGPRSPSSATHLKQIKSSVASNPDSCSVQEELGVFDQIISLNPNRQQRNSNPQVALDPDEIHMANALDDNNVYICVSPSSVSTRSLDLFTNNHDTFVPGSASLPPAMRTHHRNDSTASSDSVLKPFRAPSLKSEFYPDYSNKPFSIMSNNNHPSFLKHDPLNDISRPFSLHSEKLKPIIQRVDSFNEEIIARSTRQPDSAMFSVATDNSEKIKNYIDHSPHSDLSRTHKSFYYPKAYSQHSHHSYTSYTSLPPNSAHSFGMSPFISPKPHSIHQDQSLQLGRMLIDNQAAVQLLASSNNNQVKKRPNNEQDDVDEEEYEDEKYKDKKQCLADNVRASCHQCKCKKDPVDLAYCHTQMNRKLGIRACHKKFCKACLERSTNELLIDVVKDKSWICPSCRGNCICAACRRKNSEIRQSDVSQVLMEEIKRPASMGSNSSGSRFNNVVQNLSVKQLQLLSEFGLQQLFPQPPQQQNLNDNTSNHNGTGNFDPLYFDPNNLRR